jgi:hypothetical protein
MKYTSELCFQYRLQYNVGYDCQHHYPKESTMPDSEKIRENRLRRMADRQGLALRKSGRRDPRAIDYGMYALIEPVTNAIVVGAASGRFDFSLDDIESYLTPPIPSLLGQGASNRESAKARAAVQSAARRKPRGG